MATSTINQPQQSNGGSVEGLTQTSLATMIPDRLRSDEYAYLDQQGHIYLDYTGASLPSRTQLQTHAARLAEYTSGNPHSINPTSEVSNTLIARTRARILEFLRADPNEYAVIFASNATAAAKLVGESYRFRRNSRLVLTVDNHNSINGLRSFAQKAKAKTVYIPIAEEDFRTASKDVSAALRSRALRCIPKSSAPSLFAFPAQSNFTGVTHPLSWITLAQKQGYDVLLDAAAYLPTNDLDLGSLKPEFLIVSWYKLFGFPTGVGCLIARRDALSKLDRPWFSGGTVDAVSVRVPWHGLASDEAAFEDGTMNFLSIPDVEVGINWIQQAGRRETAIRVLKLTEGLLNSLRCLKHSNGQPMVLIYGPANIENRGGTVAFNLLDVNGDVIDSEIVACDAAAANISIRTGCFCNPGVGEVAFGLGRESICAYIKKRSEAIDALAPLPRLASAVRVSFGIASHQRDADAFVQLVKKMYRDRGD